MIDLMEKGLSRRLRLLDGPHATHNQSAHKNEEETASTD